MTDNVVGTEVTRLFSDDELRNITSISDAIKVFEQNLGASIVQASEELGNGFALVDDAGKNRLCGVPLFLLSWQFHEGDFGEFVTVYAISNHNGQDRKYVINDGSTGIYAQLRGFTDRTDRTGGMLVARGLRRSDYTVEVEGKSTKATTFYLDTSAAID